MKITRILLLSMLILTLTLVAASCDVSDLIEETLPREVENRFDNLEDRIENEYKAVPQSRTEPTTQPAREPSSDKRDGKRDKTHVGEVALTPESAEAIALEHAGVPAEAALYLRTEPDREDGVPVYEVEFAVPHPDGTGYLEYEYTIHADNGTILEYETDFERGR